MHYKSLFAVSVLYLLSINSCTHCNAEREKRTAIKRVENKRTVFFYPFVRNYVFFKLTQSTQNVDYNCDTIVNLIQN
jgi:hypothetical protein